MVRYISSADSAPAGWGDAGLVLSVPDLRWKLTKCWSWQSPSLHQRNFALYFRHIIKIPAQFTSICSSRIWAVLTWNINPEQSSWSTSWVSLCLTQFLQNNWIYFIEKPIKVIKLTKNIKPIVERRRRAAKNDNKQQLSNNLERVGFCSKCCAKWNCA